ncbi:tetratricopeptide repeat protein [Eisenibacter elegans]|uniref:tetratricopeptide repeat protein n=1 Tax=Eisenibacter elegans TaxID=997 RepID=UPI0004035EB1|nr:tetratricopeptide repeat protein [Eisenibacter elegans]
MMMYQQLFRGIVLGLLLCLGQAETLLAQRKQQTNPVEKKNSRRAQGGGVEAGYYLIEGMKHYALEDYLSALKQFQTALEFDNSSSGIYHRIAICQERLSNLPAALEAAQKALDLDGSNKHLYLHLAQLYEEQRNYEQAAKVYETLIATVPEQEKYYLDAANAYLFQKKYKEALRVYTLLETKWGLQEEIIQRKQRLYLLTDQVDKAIDEGNRLLEQFPGNADYLLAQAELMLANGRIHQALPLLEEAIALDSNIDPRLYAVLADAYRQKDDNGKAFQYLSKTLETNDLSTDEKIDLLLKHFPFDTPEEAGEPVFQIIQSLAKAEPQHARLQALYADVLYRKRDLPQAAQYYALALSQNPDHQKMWERLLQIHTQLLQADSLLHYSELALELYPNVASFWIYQGIAQGMLQDYDQAQLTLEEARRLAFDNQALLNECGIRLGDVYAAQKDYKAAFAAYQGVLDQTPDYAPALYRYSIELIKQKTNLPLARQMTERLVKQHPQEPQYLYAYAQALYQSKDYKNARIQLEKALVLSSEGYLLESYGDVLFKLGNKEQALEQWKQAQKRGYQSENLEKKINTQSLYE